MAATLREKPSPGSDFGPLDSPAADSAPFLLLPSKSPKILFSPPITNALMGAGGRGICKAHNKPPAASRLTNVMLYFIIAAAAAAAARALQIPHPARRAGTGPRHSAGAGGRSAAGTDARNAGPRAVPRRGSGSRPLLRGAQPARSAQSSLSSQ